MMLICHLNTEGGKKAKILYHRSQATDAAKHFQIGAERSKAYTGNSFSMTVVQNVLQFQGPSTLLDKGTFIGTNSVSRASSSISFLNSFVLVACSIYPEP